MISTLRKTLDTLYKIIDGLVSMTNELDEVLNCMLDNKLLPTWAKVAYPSLKPLVSWSIDFI